MNQRRKLLVAMCIFMLICLLSIGFFAFPVGLTVCGIAGTAYGLRCNDKRFAFFAFGALLVGLAWAVYTLFLIKSM